MDHRQTPAINETAKAVTAKAKKRPVPTIAIILLIIAAVLALSELLAGFAMPAWQESGEPFALLALLKQGADGRWEPAADASAAALAAAPTPSPYKTVDGLLLDRVDGGYAVAGHQGDAVEVIIPAQVDGVPVVGIQDHAFAEFNDLMGITIPESITSIGEYAFFGCYNLADISIPAGVAAIGDAAFAGIASSARITVAEGNAVFAVEDGILFDKQQNKLLWVRPDRPATGYRIPESTAAVGAYAFYECRNLSDITIPGSVTSIGEGAFAYIAPYARITVESDNTVFAVENAALIDKQQKKLLWCYPMYSDGGYVIPDGITSIGAYAFAECDDMTAVIIPEGVASIGEHAFDNCNRLTRVTIPGSVASIGGAAFIYCPGLSSVLLPEGVISIGELAFFGCEKLTDISLPESVASIGDGAFSYGPADVRITVAPGNTVFAMEGGALIDRQQQRLLWYRGGFLKNRYRIPENVTSVGAYACYSCEELTRITIHEGVTFIGEHAFAACPKLTLVVPKGSYAEQYAIADGRTYIAK